MRKGPDCYDKWNVHGHLWNRYFLTVHYIIVVTKKLCHNHNPTLSSFTTCYWMFNSYNTIGATSAVVTTYSSGANEFTPCFSQPLVFCIVFCRSLSFLFFLAIILSLLQFMASDYAFVHCQKENLVALIFDWQKNP